MDSERQIDSEFIPRSADFKKIYMLPFTLGGDAGGSSGDPLGSGVQGRAFATKNTRREGSGLEDQEKITDF